MLRLAFCLALALCMVSWAYGLPSLSTTHESWSNQSRYGLMFDAGSSGTRLFIYQWFEGDIPSVWGAPVYQPFNSSDWTYRVSPGLSSFAGAESDLQAYFEPFLLYALDRIPARYWSRTYIFLYATAGMRLLSEPQQSKILAETRKIFVSWPFRFLEPSWARIISGVDEGVYGWMTANYLLNNFEKNDPSATVGALDLGGASTQITFVSETPLPPHLGGTSINVGKTTYHLYSVSYLGYGIDQARITKNYALAQQFCRPDLPCQSITDSCLPIGYFTRIPIWNGTSVLTRGGSNGTICESEADQVFVPSACPNCPIGAIYQPPLRGPFYAMSAFTYSVGIWGLNGQNTSILDIEAAAQQWCDLPISELRNMHPKISTYFLSTYCFTGVYQTELLRKYGFDPSSRTSVIYTEKIGSTPLSWTLGAMVNAAGIVDNMPHSG